MLSSKFQERAVRFSYRAELNGKRQLPGTRDVQPKNVFRQKKNNKQQTKKQSQCVTLGLWETFFLIFQRFRD